MSKFNFMFADDDVISIGPWHIYDFFGSVEIQSYYRTQTNTFKNGGFEKQNSYGILGRAKLNLKSYIVTPKLMKLDVAGEWAPNAYQANYIVTPDRSESTTAERLQAQTTFFDGTFMPLTLFGLYSHSFTNRELTSDVELYAKSYGANFSIRNPFIPVSFIYSNGQWDQREMATGMLFFNKSETSSMMLTKSIGSFNKNEVVVSYEDTKYKYTGNEILQSYITRGKASTRFHFKGRSNMRFSLRGDYYHREGFQFYERKSGQGLFSMDLPERFKFTADYQVYDSYLNGIKSIVNHPIVRLENYLYESLHSYAFYELYDISHTSFKEKRNIGGIGLNYEKFIPTGKMYIDYELRYENNNRKSNPVPLVINNEEYVLENSTVTIIRFPYVREESIYVKNWDGTIIYRKDIDYTITQKGDYTQLSRLPGGLIENGSKVYVDYISDMKSTYSYDRITNDISVRFVLFNNFLNIYSKFTGNNYFNVDTSAFTILYTLNRNLFGMQFNVKNVSLGAELDNYNTNNLPYISYRVYLRYADYLMNAFSLSFDSDFIYYHFKNDNDLQRVVNMTVAANYPMNHWSSFRLSSHFRNQVTTASLLRVLNTRLLYEINYYQTLLTVGVEFFYRNVDNYVNDYKGLFLRLERSF